MHYVLIIKQPTNILVYTQKYNLNHKFALLGIPSPTMFNRKCLMKSIGTGWFSTVPYHLCIPRPCKLPCTGEPSCIFMFKSLSRTLPSWIHLSSFCISGFSNQNFLPMCQCVLITFNNMLKRCVIFLKPYATIETFFIYTEDSQTFSYLT